MKPTKKYIKVQEIKEELKHKLLSKINKLK